MLPNQVAYELQAASLRNADGGMRSFVAEIYLSVFPSPIRRKQPQNRIEKIVLDLCPPLVSTRCYDAISSVQQVVDCNS